MNAFFKRIFLGLLTTSGLLSLFIQKANASEIYITGRRLQLALESIYNSQSVGVGSKQCLLCHNSNSGGAGNINTGFGQDFVDTALIVVGTRGGNSLPATGNLSLESILSDEEFATMDSDGDGRSNGFEFEANTDPSDDQNGSTASQGGGGCGMVKPMGPNQIPPTALVLLFLPLLLLLSRFFNKKRPLRSSDPFTD